MTLLGVMSMNAQDIPIFAPGMSITGYGLVDSPVGEEVDKIIDDNYATKFLDFELGDGMGFTVDLGGFIAAAVAIEMTTANDFPERDPIDFEVLGSDDGTSFTSIATGTVPCITDRFETRFFTFTNKNYYTHYRVNFSDACDPTGGAGIPSIQLAEVQLYEFELGIDDTTLSGDQVSVYPNPNNGTFTLEYTGAQELSEIQIVDTMGKIVQNIVVDDFTTPQEIQTYSLVSGIYFLKISTQNRSVAKKLIIR